MSEFTKADEETLSRLTMPKQLKQDWVEALRSGVYPQTAGKLYRADLPTDDSAPGSGYCCLGVLQKVADGKCEVYQEGNPDYWTVGTVRHAPTQEWYDAHGLRERVDDLHYLAVGESVGILMNLNDAAGASFTEIADVIEKYVKGV